ncbi:MAG TPA: hypothetical protein VHF07_09540 [Nitrospiraceae bacterium]|nr:hypothetical protein [Nitrospiraceae bacterium]
MFRLAPVSLLILILWGCALFQAKETRYLKTAQDHATQEEVVEHLGRPLVATVSPQGNAVWIYQIREQEPGNRWTSTGLWCDEYVLTFDGRSILRHWTHTSEFHGGELMPAYCVAGGASASVAGRSRTRKLEGS